MECKIYHSNSQYKDLLMKVLLTGHTGFIGQNLLNSLLKKKIKLFVTKYNNLKIPRNKSISIIDLKKKNNSFEKFDLIIHAAWRKLDNYNSKDHINKILPENLKFLKKIISSGAKNLVILGTCFELGNCHGEVDEQEKMIPITLYGKAKKLLLLNLVALQRKKNFNLTWLRIFYVYGHNQKNKSLFSQLKNFIKKKNKIFFKLTNGKQKRDYLDVNVLSRRIISIAFLRRNLGVTNVCSGKPISVKKLVFKWKKNFKWDIEFEFGSKKLRKYEPEDFWGSIKKMKKVLKKA